jgi:hypothetical protein
MTEAEQLAVSYIDEVCNYLENTKFDEDYLREVEKFMYYMDDASRRDYRKKLMADVGHKALKGISVRDKPLDIQKDLSTAIFKCICSKFDAEKFPMRVLYWNEATVLKIVKNVCKKDAGILGDALEDAGYENQVVIAHLREPKFDDFHCGSCNLITKLHMISEFIDL